MVSSYLINIGDHWSFHHRFDASTLYSKPRKDQRLDHLQGTKIRRLLPIEEVKMIKNKDMRENRITPTSGPSSASPAMQP